MSHSAGVNPTSDTEAGPAMTDPYAAWIKRIATGDAAAFEMLFRALYDRLCVFAESYVGSLHAAEEIVDEVFLTVWRERQHLQIRTSVVSYLFVATRNKAMTCLRRAKLERGYIERMQGMATVNVVNAGGEIEQQLVTSELIAYVKEAVGYLPPRARQTYELYYQQHLTYAEIAQVMGVSVKTVENQLSRALKILWSRLKDRLI